MSTGVQNLTYGLINTCKFDLPVFLMVHAVLYFILQIFWVDCQLFKSKAHTAAQVIKNAWMYRDLKLK